MAQTPYKAIPDPLPTLESLRNVAQASKEVIEVLTGQRSSGANASVITRQTLIDMGLLNNSAENIRDNGGLLKDLDDLLTAGTVDTALQAANNLSDVASAATARTNLGLVIGTNVQAYDAQLFSNIPQNSQSAAYTLVLTDGQKHIFHPAADVTARTWTIPANSSVAFPVGTAITFINEGSAGVITIAITTDTLVLAGPGTTGSRTLAAHGVATAIKKTTTSWIISGTGLT